MYDEAAQQTRRSRKVSPQRTRHTKQAKPGEVEETKPEEPKPAKPRNVIRLPSFLPWRFYDVSRITELAQKAQRNYEDPSYDHTEKKWLSDEETAELERLLSEGFDSWSNADYHAFVQSSIDLGPENYAAIATAIGTKTEEEVRRYAEVFWRCGEWVCRRSVTEEGRFRGLRS